MTLKQLHEILASAGMSLIIKPGPPPDRDNGSREATSRRASTDSAPSRSADGAR